ncbi:MAG: hypothetical protein ACRDIY_11155 [Chloroflexota bacterium]
MALVGSVAVALLAYHARQRGGVLILATPFAWGIAAGFRPELAAMLGPLVLYAVWPSVRRSPRVAPLLAGLGCLGVALWLVPLIHVTGGVLIYLRLLHGRSLSSSILPWVFARNWPVAIRLTIWNVAVGLAYLTIAVLGVLPLQILRLGSPALKAPSHPSRGFALFWFVPGLLVDIITVVGHSGYVLAYLPPLLLLLWPRKAHRLLVALTTVGIVLQGLYFVAVPQVSGVFDGGWLHDTLYRTVSAEPTRSLLVRDDTLTTALVNAIKERYPADRTLLIVPVGDEVPRTAPIRTMYAQARYYLPEWHVRILYTTRLLDFDALGLPRYVIAEVFRDQFNLIYTQVVTAPTGYAVRWLVWFCDADSTAYPFNSGWKRYQLPSGITMIVGDLSKPYPGTRTWGPFEFPAEGASSDSSG